MSEKANYGYLVQRGTDPTLADKSGDSFKIASGAELVETNKPDKKAMRYMGKGDESSFDVTKAGAGRGKQGGPTAKQFKEANMSAAEKNARQDILEEKYTRKTKDQDYAKGGKVSASSRADGIAQRGKTRGTIVACGGGMMRGKK